MVGIVIVGLIVAAVALVSGVFLYKNNKAKADAIINQAKTAEKKVESLIK